MAFKKNINWQKLRQEPKENPFVQFMMHANGGNEFNEEGTEIDPTYETHIDTPMWIRDVEIQVQANEHQKLSISREDGKLVLYFWFTGITDNSDPDAKLIFHSDSLEGEYYNLVKTYQSAKA